MALVIAPGALCLVMSMDGRAAPEWPPGAGTDAFSLVGRGSIR